MTMRIDEALQAKAMAATWAKCKTTALSKALRKVAAKSCRREGLLRGLG